MGAVGGWLQPHLAGGGMEQGQDLGRAAPDVFVRLLGRVFARLPRHAGMRHGLKRPRLVLTPDREPKLRAQRVGLLNQLFLARASGSRTRTTPCLRLRLTTPVSHQVRLVCQLRPAACSVRQIVNVLTRGSPVRSFVQGFLQQAQRPRRRAVLVALGRAGPFGQNALLRVSPIADPWSTPMARPHSGEPVAVEAADPGGDGLGVPSSDLVGGPRVARAIRNGQQRSGALALRGGRGGRAAQAGQLLALIRRERAKGICPVARHGTPRGTRTTPPQYQILRQTTHWCELSTGCPSGSERGSWSCEASASPRRTG